MFAFVAIFTIIGTVVVLFLTMAHGNAVDRKLEEALDSIQDFHRSVFYKSSICKNAVAIDIDNEKIAVILNPLKIMALEIKPVVYSFEDLIAVELTRDDATLVKTNRGSQVTGAALGGVLLGPAGMLLGGLSASKREESKVRKLSLKLYTDDLIRPVQEVFFWDSGNVGVDPQQLKPIFNDLDEWYGRFRVIVERRKRAG